MIVDDELMIFDDLIFYENNISYDRNSSDWYISEKVPLQRNH